jgi:hypothetical protein
MARNPKAYIRIRGRSFDFRCYLGNGRPRVTGGGAEYEAQRRPQADSATIFNGNGLLTVDVPVLFDGWGPPGDRNDIGPHLDQVYNLCFGRGRKPPPNFIATYPGPGSGSRFQMSLPEELDDPKPIVGPGGTVFRQALVLKLVEFNDPSDIDFVKRGPVASKKREADLTSIVLQHPMSLLEVAAKFLNGPGDAKDLGDLNNVKDLRKKLPKGTRVKLGTAANLNYAVEAR